jgi:DNA-binding winged helix-turn-helix (wHTH) protein
VLAILLAQPGDVVTREDLQKQLCPTDTFVDFDRGLNKAINRLRDALGDSAEAPRFIETLPKRGYRFIGTFEPPRRRYRTQIPFCRHRQKYRTNDAGQGEPAMRLWPWVFCSSH